MSQTWRIVPVCAFRGWTQSLTQTHWCKWLPLGLVTKKDDLLHHINYIETTILTFFLETHLLLNKYVTKRSFTTPYKQIYCFHEACDVKIIDRLCRCGHLKRKQIMLKPCFVNKQLKKCTLIKDSPNPNFLLFSILSNWSIFISFYNRYLQLAMPHQQFKKKNPNKY